MSRDIAVTRLSGVSQQSAYTRFVACCGYSPTLPGPEARKTRRPGTACAPWHMLQSTRQFIAVNPSADGNLPRSSSGPPTQAACPLEDHPPVRVRDRGPRVHALRTPGTPACRSLLLRRGGSEAPPRRASEAQNSMPEIEGKGRDHGPQNPPEPPVSQREAGQPIADDQPEHRQEEGGPAHCQPDEEQATGGLSRSVLPGSAAA